MKICWFFCAGICYSLAYYVAELFLLVQGMSGNSTAAVWTVYESQCLFLLLLSLLLVVKGFNRFLVFTHSNTSKSQTMLK